MEFTASTGNRCRIEMIRSGTVGDAIGVCWDRSPTPLEMKEVNDWFAAQNPERICAGSTLSEDRIAREAEALLFSETGLMIDATKN